MQSRTQPCFTKHREWKWATYDTLSKLFHKSDVLFCSYQISRIVPLIICCDSLKAYSNMGRAVRKGPLGHKLSKMSYCRHVIVQILKNLGVQTVFWNSTPKYPKRGIEKDLFFPKSCMRALTILQHLQSARGPRDRGGQRCFKSFWSFFLEFSPAFFPILWSSTSPCHVVISVINILWILGFHDNR